MSNSRLIAPNANDRLVKRERLLQILQAKDAESLVLTSQAAVAWYLDGARVHVSLAGDPVCAVVVEHAGDRIITPSNERERLELEEFPPGLEIVPVPWHAALRSALPTGPRVLQEAAVTTELRAARAPLLPAELERFRLLGRDAANVLTDVLAAAAPEQSEQRIVADIGRRLLDLQIDPLVILAAGRDRLHFRHPLPTLGLLGDRAMIVACGRRQGLIINLTRWVGFGVANPAEADFFAATLPGETVSSAFEGGIRGYARHGFDAHEWQRHHQGGPAGYNGRDPRATMSVSDTLHSNQAFSWNPTVLGAKSEDTVLAAASGLEVLTRDPRWPVTRVNGLDRPAELRH